MSQFPHDEFVKEVLPELYQNYGQVIPSADVSSERREVDILFIPDKSVPTTPDTLGLLGKIAQTTCLIEVYRNHIQAEQIMDCIGKLISVKNNLLKDQKKDIALWIITPTVSKQILSQFSGQPQENWEKGVYFLPQGFNTGIIAVHQLPKTAETLWLRLFGRDKIQLSAIEELESLPDNHPSRKNILKSVYGLLNAMEANQNKSLSLNQKRQVLIMSLRAILDQEFAQREEEAVQQGIQQGEIKGKLETVPLLIQLGMSVDDIANRLNLPLEMIKKAVNPQN
jgi:hypothetical protein